MVGEARSQGELTVRYYTTKKLPIYSKQNPMNRLLFVFFLFFSTMTFSQSPTFQALLELNHNVNNNEFDLEIKPTQEDFSREKSIVWNNVYFKYFKNSNIRSSQRRDESMKFSIRYQFLYSLYCKSATTLTINVAKGAKDKFLDVDLVVFNLHGNKIVGTKVKGKSYSLVKEERNIKIQIDEGVIEPGTIVRLLVDTESYNVKRLGPFSFSQPITSGYTYILTANIPEMFKYTIPDNLRMDSKKIESIKLKEFTYSNPPIVDYDATSFSYKWTVTSGQVDDFRLESIDLFKDFGTSVEQLMATSD